MSVKILVCGGAGYIGSHMVKMLDRSGYSVVTFDNLSTGHREAVKWGEFFQGDLLDKAALERVFQAHQFDAVMHFSARSLVGESVQKPEIYYENNVIGTFNLLEQMRRSGVGKFVFSSTAATFGLPQKDLIDESHSQLPINPYGKSKLMVEWMLDDFFHAHGIDSVSLRYFNAAGADPDGEIGESHDPETHLIPNVLKSVLGTGPALKIFGDDYPTRDGTCVRDYIHINDLCQAHVLGLKHMTDHHGAMKFNLGNGLGFSVLDIIHAAQKVTGSSIAYSVEGRRAGDPPVLVADSALARKTLNWAPVHTDVESIIETAWAWHRNQPY